MHTLRHKTAKIGVSGVSAPAKPHRRGGRFMTPHASSIPVGLCQCGCGQVTTIAPQSHTKRRITRGVPQRFVPGHSKPKLTFENMPATKTCRMCGKTKPKECFGFVNRAYPTLYPYCKPCAAEKQRTLPLDCRILNNAFRRAQKKGVPFRLTKADLVIPETCPILGITLRRNRGCPGDNSFSIDEITPGLGYTPTNCQIISSKANRMKSDATVEELLRFADWVYRTYGT